MKSPLWISWPILIFCLVSTHQAVKHQNLYRRLSLSDGSTVYARLSDFTHYREAGGDNLDATNFMPGYVGMKWWTYPRWAATLYRPATWIPERDAIIINSIILALCVFVMARLVLPLPGGWIIAIVGSMFAKYSIIWGNMHPILCLASMFLVTSPLAIAFKPYFVVFPLLKMWLHSHKLTGEMKITLTVGLSAFALFCLFTVNETGIFRFLLTEEPYEFWISKRNFIVIFPAYYLLWKYVPESWFRRTP